MFASDTCWGLCIRRTCSGLLSGMLGTSIWWELEAWRELRMSCGTVCSWNSIGWSWLLRLKEQGCPLHLQTDSNMSWRSTCQARHLGVREFLVGTQWLGRAREQPQASWWCGLFSSRFLYSAFSPEPVGCYSYCNLQHNKH